MFYLMETIFYNTNALQTFFTSRVSKIHLKYNLKENSNNNNNNNNNTDSAV